MPRHDDPCVPARLDTWRNCSAAGRWTWSIDRQPASDAVADVNAWATAELKGLFDAIRPFARVREMLLDEGTDVPPEALDVTSRELRWQPGVPHDAFERHLLERTRTMSVPIANIALAFDLLVWVRTDASPTVPVLGWVHRIGGGTLALRPLPAGASLEMHSTLFFSGNWYGDSNLELSRLNQPLLRDALAAIEAKGGPITEVDGLPSVSRTGFDEYVAPAGPSS